MELVVVKETLLAELAERVALVAGVLRVSLPAVPGQLLPAVLPQLKGEQFEVLAADVAVDQAVRLAGVVSQEAKGAKDRFVAALAASVCLQRLVPFVKLSGAEKVAMLPVNFAPVGREGERLYGV